MVTRLSRKGVAVACAVVFATGAMAGCGGEEKTTTTSSPSSSPEASDSSTPSPTAPDPTQITSSPEAGGELPECDAIWVAGQRVPDNYEGCETPGGEIVNADSTYCESGQELITYDNRFYAARGGKINPSADLKRDRVYQRQLRSCRG